jgi:small subunit ribosomal protein S8e
VRTNTLVKGAIISIDATPYRVWYGHYFGVALGKKKKGEEAKVPRTRSANEKKKLEERNKTRVLDPNIEQQFLTGRLLARISSRPGQSGRCDGYILEGQELLFYQRKLRNK